MEFSIWVTGKCNMRCKYCYVEEKKIFENMDLSKIDKIVDFILHICDDKDLQINFFGGEPLLNYDFIKAFIEKMECRLDVGIEYYMTTNGTIVSDEIVSFIKEKRIKLSLSWDGCKEANDLNRVFIDGGGTFSKIKCAYHIYREGGIDDIRVRATFNKDTYKYIKESVDEFISTDTEISVLFVPDYFDTRWTSEDINELYKIAEIVRKYENISICGEASYRCCRCSGGISSFHIYLDGKIYPCSFVVSEPLFCIGDLNRGLNTSAIHKLAQRYTQSLSGCEDCDYQYGCLSYKCRYLNYSLTGKMNKASAIVCGFENFKVNK
ncbi:MAG: radical SAM protein [Lachnospiraceae bacterium]|nr:radical SAM protein [Lachnospiraceae bacterium]